MATSNQLPLQECIDCGKRTRERTVGTPNGICPKRNNANATHRYRVIGE